MGGGVTKLGAGFDPVSYGDWRNLVDAALNGLSFQESLVARTYDGIELQPIHPRAGQAAAQPSFVRRGTWDIYQRIDHPDLVEANALIRADLAGGAAGIELVYAASSAARGHGLSTEKVADFDRLLDGVALEKVKLRIDSGHENRHISALLVALAERRGTDPGAVRLQFVRDPISYLAVKGHINNRFDFIARRVGDTVRGLKNEGFRVTALMPDGRTWHAAGASEAQELALLIGSAVTYLKALEENGPPLDEAFGLIGFLVAADADQFLTVAKIRALRRLWARVQEASGVEPTPVHIHAETAWRMMTSRAPHVNIARATLAAFAAGAGGADSITVLPFTSAIGLPCSFARRIARNTQTILLEEANAHRVLDPVAGSGAAEALTDALARKAWTLFTEIEKAGGMIEGLQSGRIQEMIRKVRETRMQNIAVRKELITGVSDFADLEEQAVDVLQASTADIVASSMHLLLPPPGSGELFEALLQAARSGGSLADMVLARGSLVQRIGETLPQTRSAEPFERLRDASDARYRLTGTRPAVFMARLGPEEAFAERAAFAENIFALAGVVPAGSVGLPVASPSAMEVKTDIVVVADAFRASGARIACICSSDDIYRELAGPAAEALRRADAGHIVLVGHPGERRDIYAQSGVGSFLYDGCNVVEILTEALRGAGVALDQGVE